MNKTAKNVLKTILFLAIGSIILFLVYLKFNANFQADCDRLGTPSEECNFFKIIISYIKSADYLWVGIALCFYLLSNVSRALRWRMLLEPMSHKPKFMNAFSTVMIGYLVNLGIPRSGEFVRAGILAQNEKMEPEKVMGTIVTSRVIDVICLALTIGLTLILSFNNFTTYFRENEDIAGKFEFITPAFMVIVGIVGLLLIYLFWKYQDKLFNTTIGKKLKKILLGFWEGIISIRNLKNPGAFIFHTLVIWVCYYLMTYLMFFSFDPVAGLEPVAGLVVFVFGTLGIVIPSPGGMGTYQYLISEALMLYGVAYTEAFAFANIMFFSVQICNIILGALAFILLPIYNRNA